LQTDLTDLPIYAFENALDFKVGQLDLLVNAEKMAACAHAQHHSQLTDEYSN
jgi:hypothetical protein